MRKIVSFFKRAGEEVKEILDFISDKILERVEKYPFLSILGIFIIIILIISINFGIDFYRRYKKYKDFINRSKYNMEFLKEYNLMIPKEMENMKAVIKWLLEIKKEYYILVSLPGKYHLVFTKPEYTPPKPNLIVWLPIEWDREVSPAIWLYLYFPDKDDPFFKPDRVKFFDDPEIHEDFENFIFATPVSFLIIPEDYTKKEAIDAVKRAMNFILSKCNLTMEDLRYENVTKILFNITYRK